MAVLFGKSASPLCGQGEIDLIHTRGRVVLEKSQELDLHPRTGDFVVEIICITLPVDKDPL
jgi:hypothetical protein